jgi:hypothetical protein
MFIAMVARPAAASIAMGASVRLLHESIPRVGAPAFLLLASVVGAGGFIGTWMLLPGGKAELAGLVADLRAAFGRRVAVTKPAEPLAVVGELAL